jgi:hypothetical protein
MAPVDTERVKQNICMLDGLLEVLAVELCGVKDVGGR